MEEDLDDEVVDITPPTHSLMGLYGDMGGGGGRRVCTRAHASTPTPILTPAPAQVGRKMLFYTSAVTILTLIINAPLAAPLLRWASKQRDEDEVCHG